MQKEKLGDAVKRIRNDKKISLAEVRARSGKSLAASYISRIENNQVKPEAISSAKLQALARGLGEPENYIFDLARGVSLSKENIADHRFAEIADGYGRLSAQERRNLEPLLAAIEMSIRQHEGVSDQKAVKRETVKEFGEASGNAPRVLPESEYKNLGIKKLTVKKKTLPTK